MVSSNKQHFSGLESENRALRERLRKLEDQAADNSAVLTQLRTHELALINAASLPALIDVFTRGSARTFGLDNVTLALADPQGQWQRLIAANDRDRQPPSPAALFARHLATLSPAYKDLLRPALSAYSGAAHRTLFPQPPTPRSVALLPLRRQGIMLGALNCGSLDRERFTASHATDFLSHFSHMGAVFLENAMAREELRQSTYTDGLTGCHNRRSLQERLTAELARSMRYRQPLCFMLFDLDHFKTVNDTHGHLVGDQVLVEFATRLRRALRINDVVARYGGEEFAALLPQTALDDALALAERVRQKVSEPMMLDPHALSVTVSVGVCEFRARAPDKNLDALVQKLLGSADEALYRAKAAGRNRIERGALISSELDAGA